MRDQWEPAGSTERPQGQGGTLSLSPDSSWLCLTPPDGSLHPWSAAEEQHKDSSQSQSPSQSRSCSGQGGAEADPDPSLRSPRPEEPNQGGSQEQQGHPSASCREELEEPMAAGDGLDSPLDCADTGGDRGAEHREDEAENDTEIPVHHQLLESEPCSSSREEISAIEELPREQQSIPNSPRDAAPASPGAGDVPAARESVLCRLWKPGREGGAAQPSGAAWSLPASFHPSCSQELIQPPAPCSPVG